MKIALNTEVDIEEIAKNLTAIEMFTLFTKAVNLLEAHNISSVERRKLAGDFSSGMSESAKRLLAEIFAAEYCNKQLK